MQFNRFALSLGAVTALAAIGACGGDDPIATDPNQQVEEFEANLSGGNVRPAPTTSTGAGSGFLRIYSSRADANSDFAVDSMTYALTYSGLSANATGAYLHAPASTEDIALVAHNLSAPAQTSGQLSGKITTPSTTSVTLAELAGHVRAGHAYFDVTSPDPYHLGEIRGQLVAAD